MGGLMLTVFLGVLGILVGVAAFWGVKGFNNLIRDMEDKAAAKAVTTAMKNFASQYDIEIRETKIDAAVGDKNQSNPSQKTTTKEELK